MNIFDTARLLKPTLSDLGPEFKVQEQKAENPHLAIEALRDLPTEESGRTTRHNLVPQRAFSERIKELMNKYTSQQLTSVEVKAELIEMARRSPPKATAASTSANPRPRTSWRPTTR